MRRSRSPAALIAQLVLAAGCVPALELPTEAQVRCVKEGDCPADFRCLSDVQRCVAPDSPCVDARGALPNGTGCGDERVCHDGSCRERGCGDGVVEADRGEACEPSGASACREDCQLPLCGDGVLDPGETCEGGEGCFLCVRACSLGEADCNGDVSDGCECEPRTLGDEMLPTRAVATEDDVWVVNSVSVSGTYRQQLRRYPVAGGEPSVGEELPAVAINTHDGAVYSASLVQSGFAMHTLVEIHRGGETETLAELTSFRAFAIAVSDTGRVWFAGNTGVAFLNDDGTHTAVSDKCTIALDLSVCGDVVLCKDFETTNLTANSPAALWAINAVTGEERLLARAPGVFGGCGPDQQVVWRDSAAVWLDHADGHTSLIAVLPPNASQMLKLTDVLSFDGGEVYFSLAPAGLFPMVFRLDRSTGAMEGIAAGTPLATHRLGVVMVDALGSSLQLLERD